MRTIFKKPLFFLVIISIIVVLGATTAYMASIYRNDPGATTTVNEHSVCKKVVNAHATRSYFIPTNSANEWSLFRSAAPSLPGLSLAECTTYLTISSNTQNYNIYTAAGSPSVATSIELTINSSVDVSSTGTGSPALDTGNLPSGSTVTIVNNGTIVGKGGNGGAGASISYNGNASGDPGGSGGNAINTTVALTVNNTNGNIWGGGGGGGGGGEGRRDVEAGSACGMGGGGGGGADRTSSNGGAAGTSSYGCNELHYGNPGGNGTNSGGGAGGLGGSGGDGGNGGNGGDYGSNGASGIGIDNPGGAGGAAGKAVNLNGNSITWTGGNNGTQVKGAVQ